MGSVCFETRFVVDCDTLLRIAAGEIEIAAEHKLVAPTLVRSQALSALYGAARRGEISAAEGIERVYVHLDRGKIRMAEPDDFDDLLSRLLLLNPGINLKGRVRRRRDTIAKARTPPLVRHTESRDPETPEPRGRQVTE
jgi:hypothetical protein